MNATLLDDGWIVNQGLVQARDDRSAFDNDVDALLWVLACANAGSVRHEDAWDIHGVHQPEDLVDIIHRDLGLGDAPAEIAAAVSFLRRFPDWSLDDDDRGKVAEVLEILRERLRDFIRI